MQRRMRTGSELPGFRRALRVSVIGECGTGHRRKMTMETLNLRNRVASIAIQATVGLLAVVALTVGTPARAEAKTKYYLTRGTFQGNAVLTACAGGYHPASLWEIRDTSNLQYDTSRGVTQADSGSGPPSEAWGWIRTGSSSNSTGDIGT